MSAVARKRRVDFTRVCPYKGSHRHSHGVASVPMPDALSMALRFSVEHMRPLGATLQLNTCERQAEHSITPRGQRVHVIEAHFLTDVLGPVQTPSGGLFESQSSKLSGLGLSTLGCVWDWYPKPLRERAPGLAVPAGSLSPGVCPPFLQHSHEEPLEVDKCRPTLRPAHWANCRQFAQCAGLKVGRVNTLPNWTEMRRVGGTGLLIYGPGGAVGRGAPLPAVQESASGTPAGVAAGHKLGTASSTFRWLSGHRDAQAVTSHYLVYNRIRQVYTETVGVQPTAMQACASG